MSIHAGDLLGLRLGIIGRLRAVDMTATAAFNVFQNGPNQCLLTQVIFSTFSAYPDGQALPSAFGYSWGINSTTAPNDMRSATTFGAALIAPAVVNQNLTSSPSYITAGASLYFAITATTGAVGTMNVTFIGGILNK